MDRCESLLTNNEIFPHAHARHRILTRRDIEAYGVTGPLARASGWDHDLRRDAPYAAYDRIPVNVALGEAGDTFIATPCESLRCASPDASRSRRSRGCQKGRTSRPTQRSVRPPAGIAYREVESPRGELGEFVVSDGSALPTVAVEGPLGRILKPPRQGLRVEGDVIPLFRFVDVVMGTLMIVLIGIVILAVIVLINTVRGDVLPAASGSRT